MQPCAHMGMKPADDRSAWKGTWDHTDLKPNSGAVRGTDPSKNKEELRQLPRLHQESTRAVIKRLPPAAREWYFLSRRIQVKCLVAAAIFLPVYHP